MEFDVDALRKKYALERDRRLRADGIAQYVEIAGPFARFADDPWCDPHFTRDSLTDEVDVAIIGAGFGGLLTGARLRELGVQDIRLIDKAADVGGTWYWNRYPGIACDVESYVYMPLLEELGYVPTEKYAKGDEIFAHCRRIAEHYDLYRNACLQTEVTEIRWDPAISRWIVSTNHGDAIRARFVAMANGYLQKPKLPGIDGIMDFAGHTFHTSRWDYDYTGPDLAKLADKRVGIIGTGATAIQAVPQLAKSVKRLLVFQRTPSTVDVRGNRPTDNGWSAELTDGWQRRRIENFQLLTAGGEADEDLVDDAWTSIVKKLFVMRQTSVAGISDEERLRTVDLADFAKMEEIRARVDSIVADRATAEALKPWYGYFCKRPCFHDEYLQAFNRDNVTLVDTKGLGVEQITTNGVVVDGTEHTIDCLIFATGFEVGTEYSRRVGFEIAGRDGLTLTDKWRDGVRTLHGLTVHGFPNCFVLSIAQSGFTVNFPYLLDIQATHAAWLIAWALNNAASELEASADAEAAWVDTVVGRYGCECRQGEVLHAGLLQQGGPGEREDASGQLLLWHPDRIRRHPGGGKDDRRAGRIPGFVTRARRYRSGRMLAMTRRRPSPRVVIIGAGFGGLASAVALRRKGIDDLLIIERADGVGGTWRQNVYPGAACDIQSHLYSFSFAPNRAWSRTYANQPEILAYLEKVADDFDLRRHLMLGTSVRRIRWNPAALQWDVELDSGDIVVADVVVSAVGLFGAARFPDIDGVRRLRRRSDAHRAVGYHRRPDRQAGGGGRNRCQRSAAGTRNRRRHREVDGLPAHPAMDGAQAGPTFQRRGVV